MDLQDTQGRAEDSFKDIRWSRDGQRAAHLFTYCTCTGGQFGGGGIRGGMVVLLLPLGSLA